MDRAYRIGQTRNVVVYRLISCGTIEEKIYRKQVFKGMLSKTATDKTEGSSKETYKRYFTHQELRQLFQVENPYISETHQQLIPMLQGKRKSYAELESHLKELTEMTAKHYKVDNARKPLLYGLSDHDILFDMKELTHASSAEEVQAAMDETEKSMNKLYSLTDDHDAVSRAATPKRKKATTPKRPITIKDDAPPSLSAEELKNMIIGVRLHGLSMGFRKIAIEMNISRSPTQLQAVWQQVSSGLSGTELLQMLTMYDKEIFVGKVPPPLKEPFAKLATSIEPAQPKQPLVAKRKEVIVIDEEDEDVVPIVSQPKKVSTNSTEPSEPLSAVARRLSSAFGLTDDTGDDDEDENSDEEAEENEENEESLDAEEEPDGEDLEQDNEEDQHTEDDFINDDEIEYDFEEQHDDDNQDMEDNDEDLITPVESKNIIEVPDFTPAKKKRWNVVDSDDDDTMDAVDRRLSTLSITKQPRSSTQWNFDAEDDVIVDRRLSTHSIPKQSPLFADEPAMPMATPSPGYVGESEFSLHQSPTNMLEESKDYNVISMHLTVIIRHLCNAQESNNC